MINEPKIIFIAAASKNNVIGKDNKLPWHVPEDLKFFKEKTLNQVVLSGRKTFESLPDEFKPLSMRFNIVATKKGFSFSHPSVHIINNINSFIDRFKSSGFKSFEFIPKTYKKNNQLWITGGEEIYSHLLEKADEIYITRIHKNFDGDSFFPEIPNNFKLFSKTETLASRNSLEYSHSHYVRP